MGKRQSKLKSGTTCLLIDHCLVLEMLESGGQSSLRMGFDDPFLIRGSKVCTSPGVLNTLVLSKFQIRKGTGYTAETQSSLILIDVKNRKA